MSGTSPFLGSGVPLAAATYLEVCALDYDVLASVLQSAPGATPALIADVLGIVPPEGMADALCIEYADELDWFLQRGEEAIEQRAICAECLVVDVCLDYAVEHRITSGVWGGLTPQERRRLRG